MLQYSPSWNALFKIDFSPRTRYSQEKCTLLDSFSQVDPVHSHGTGSVTGSLKFYSKISRLTQPSHHYSRLGSKIWNEIPEALRNKSKTPFKKCLQRGLLQLLAHEDTYVGVHTLIKDLNLLHSIPVN